MALIEKNGAWNVYFYSSCVGQRLQIRRPEGTDFNSAQESHDVQLEVPTRSAASQLYLLNWSTTHTTIPAIIYNPLIDAQKLSELAWTMY